MLQERGIKNQKYGEEIFWIKEQKRLELATGIEPATCGLQNRCSTN